jgi:hypothetical protein
MSDPTRPKPHQPRGALDGCAGDSKLTENMAFMGRFGSSCGTPFIVNDFCNKRRQWNYLKPFLHDRPTQPWTMFTTTKSYKKHKTHKHRETTTKNGSRKRTTDTTSS